MGRCDFELVGGFLSIFRRLLVMKIQSFYYFCLILRKGMLWCSKYLCKFGIKDEEVQKE